MPLPPSSLPVSKDPSGLSPEISPPTQQAAYTPFTPSNSGQRSPPTYYRGCWHVVSRGFLLGYRQSSSPRTVLYNPKAFLAHAALLHQAFAHCGRFPAAASRRSLGRVSVPVWPFALSGRLPIVALVGLYPANKLMGRGLIHRRISPLPKGPWPLGRTRYRPPFPEGVPVRWADHPRVTHPSAAPLPARRRGERSTCMPYARRQRSS